MTSKVDFDSEQFGGDQSRLVAYVTESVPKCSLTGQQMDEGKGPRRIDIHFDRDEVNLTGKLRVKAPIKITAPRLDSVTFLSRVFPDRKKGRRNLFFCLIWPVRVRRSFQKEALSI